MKSNKLRKELKKEQMAKQKKKSEEKKFPNPLASLNQAAASLSLRILHLTKVKNEPKKPTKKKFTNPPPNPIPNKNIKNPKHDRNPRPKRANVHALTCSFFV